MTTLNTTNPNALSFTNKQIEITVLGGINCEHFDRLLVTLKLSNGAETVRQPLDLYNDDQISRLVRKCAERLDEATADLYKYISDLTEKLESYRFKVAERKVTRVTKRLNKAEEKAALAYLKKAKLMERTQSDIAKSGVIGEELNRLLLYICFSSRKRHKPLHIICLGQSGSGKTYLQEKVSELIPEEDKIEITAFSENALYYFGERELRHKLILIEDLDGAEDVLYPLRELQSKQKISKTIAVKNSQGHISTQTFNVYGPLASSACTTKENLYDDNANRALLIYLDNSIGQDEAIMNYQRAKSAGQIKSKQEKEIKVQFQNQQRVLKPVTVINPFAHQLKLPEDVFKQRRSNELYLSLIESITFYHQYQRQEKTNKDSGEVYIESTLEDIAWANQLICQVLIRKSDELSGAIRAFFEQLKNYLNQTDKNTFYTKDLRQHLRSSPATVKRHVFSLEAYGYLKRIRGSRAKGFEYQLIIFNDYQLLQERVYKQLQNDLANLKTKHVVAQSGSVRPELLKAQ